jgi:hypothetical protein
MGKFVSFFTDVRGSWLTQINCWKRGNRHTWNIVISHEYRGPSTYEFFFEKKQRRMSAHFATAWEIKQMETREEIKRIICSSAGQVNKDSTLPALLGLGPAPSILVPQVRLVLARSPVPAPTNATTRRSLRNHKRRTQPHRRRRERLNLGRSRTWSRPCRWS